MSGLYNLVFGSSPLKHELVALLSSVQPIDTGRLRNAPRPEGSGT